eukprot:2389301-Heterocapsa_arctica.AAC.1
MSSSLNASLPSRSPCPTCPTTARRSSAPSGPRQAPTPSLTTTSRSPASSAKPFLRPVLLLISYARVRPRSLLLPVVASALVPRPRPRTLTNASS